MSFRTFFSGDLPLQTNIKLSLLSVFLQAIRRPDGTINRSLASLCEFHAPPNPNPTDGVRTEDFMVDPTRQLWFRLFLPAERSPVPLPVMVFFHGGGFAFLSPAHREYDAACRRFCKELKIVVVSINYRLSPEHRYPAQYEDGVDVLRFLESTKSHPSYCTGLLRELFMSADLSRCFLAGDSAGANISHNVARRWAATHQQHVKLQGLISIQPFFGGEARVPSELRRGHSPIVTVDNTDWMWKEFLPVGATRDHSAASPAAAAENLSRRFPPVLVIAGEFDPLLDWQRKYFLSLIRNGKAAKLIEYPRTIHAFYLFPELNGGLKLIDDLRQFILCKQDCF